MKQLFFTLAVAFTLNSVAQIKAFIPKTGDAEFDKVLTEINAKAEKDLKTFKDEVHTALGLPPAKTEELLQTMPPGDVYMVAQTAQLTAKPVDEVKTAYEKNKDKGWGETAKALGIKPGSKEFHALKGKVKENKGKGNKGGKPEDKGPKGAKGDKQEKADKGEKGGKPEDKGAKGKGDAKSKH